MVDAKLPKLIVQKNQVNMDCNVLKVESNRISDMFVCSNSHFWIDDLLFTIDF